MAGGCCVDPDTCLTVVELPLPVEVPGLYPYMKGILCFETLCLDGAFFGTMVTHLHLASLHLGACLGASSTFDI